MKKNSAMCAILLCAATSLKPISQSTAYGITAGVGAGTFVISSIITRSSFLSLLCAAPASVIAYFVSMSMTPEGRFKSATQKVNHILRNKFAEYPYDDEKMFIEALQDRYQDQFWLISAHDEIDSLLKEGYHALELLMLVKQEAHDNYRLVEEANKLQQTTRSLMKNLTNALRRIKNHIDFSAQRTAYNQLLIEKERLTIEREKAYAQQSQAAAQMAQAHAQQNQANAMWHAATKKSKK